MSAAPAEPAPGPYRHYKGGLYTVLALARHSETEQWLVVYRAEADGSLWVRPRDMWLERVTHEGTLVARFSPLPVSAAPPAPADRP